MSNYTQGTTALCAECLEEFNTDDGGMFSPSTEEWECEDCFDRSMNEASLVQIFPAKKQEVLRINVTDRFQMGSDGFEYSDSYDISRTWVKTDEWRGYYETTIKGWTVVMEGWTTGGWDDPTARRKAIWNDWFRDLADNLVDPPCEIAVITEMTSNLFSTAVSVLVKDEDLELFTEWAGEDLPDLQNALK